MDIYSLYSGSVYYVMIVLFAAFIALFSIKSREIMKHFSKVKKRRLLILIFILALAIRLFIVPHYHQMFVDEQMHLEAARNYMLHHKPLVCSDISGRMRCITYHKTPAWPFMLSFIASFGSNGAFILNSVLGALSVFLVFGFSYLLFRKENVALLSALLFAFSAVSISWSSTAESNVSGLFFALIAITLFLMKLDNRLLFWLSYSIAFLTRIEYLLLLPVFFLYDKKNRTETVIFLLLGLLVASLYYYLGYFISFVMKLLLNGEYFRIIPFWVDFFFPAVGRYIPSITNAVLLKSAALLLAVYGLTTIRKRHAMEKRFLLAIMMIYACGWLAMLFLIYNYFSFSTLRVVMIIYVCINILSALGIAELARRHGRKWLIISIIVLLSLSLLSTMNSYERKGRFEKETYVVNSLPSYVDDSCVVVAEQPVIVSGITGIRSISTAIYLKDRPEGCYYYLADSYCTRYPVSGGYSGYSKCIWFYKMINERGGKAQAAALPEITATGLFRSMTRQ